MGICHIVYPSRRGMLPAVRAMVDHLVDKLPGLIALAHAPCDAARNGGSGEIRTHG